VVSHWHDDHVRGLGDLIAACTQAHICCSSALTKEEFLGYVLNYQNIMTQHTSSGVGEILRTLKAIENRPPIKRAAANRNVLTLPVEGSANSFLITTLSPSDKEYDNFLRRIVTLVPTGMASKTRAPSLMPNNVSVAMWIESADVRMLLGADLEEKGDPDCGWTAIVESGERPRGKASLFKVPHHGSITGHHGRVWSEMMIESPFAVLSPFHQAGTMLPTAEDVARITTLAPESYVTTRQPVPKSKMRRPAAVERTIRERVGKIRATQPATGWISLRNGGRADPGSWTVFMSSTAARLKDFIIRAN
jgi:hypothetical protein